MYVGYLKVKWIPQQCTNFGNIAADSIITRFYDCHYEYLEDGFVTDIKM